MIKSKTFLKLTIYWFPGRWLSLRDRKRGLLIKMIRCTPGLFHYIMSHGKVLSLFVYSLMVKAPDPSVKGREFASWLGHVKNWRRKKWLLLLSSLIPSTFEGWNRTGGLWVCIMWNGGGIHVYLCHCTSVSWHLKTYIAFWPVICSWKNAENDLNPSLTHSLTHFSVN